MLFGGMRMSGIGEIHGYCVIWHEESGNLSKPGSPACYDRIEPHSISIARTARANYHHFRQTCFAAIDDKTLECGSDNIGIWFSANIPDDSHGRDLFNGLSGGKWLAISPELESITKRFCARTGANIITAATMTGVAIVPRDSALFAGTRCWLSGDVPNDPQAAALRAGFAVRKRRKATPVSIPAMPLAMKNALRMARR
jgi:Caudovirus prohead serine protease